MSRKEKQKKKNKGLKLIVVFIVLILITLGIVVIVKNINKPDTQEQNENVMQEQEQQVYEENVQILTDGTKLNVSEKLNENKNLDNLEIQNIQLTYRNGVTNILADVVNNGSSDFENTKIDITLLDKEGNTVYKIRGIIEETPVGETSKLNTSITADFVNAYDFTITKVK